MGYTTHVEGGFDIAPPLRFDEIKGSPFTYHHAEPASAAPNTETQIWRAPGFDLDLVVEVTESPTDGGVAHLYAASRLVMQEIDDYRAYDLPEQVQGIVNLFGDDRTYTGHLAGEGEAPGDVWRLYIDGEGNARQDQAALMYPGDIAQQQKADVVDLLRRIADEVEALPQDFELDPGRGEVKEMLRQRADELTAGS